MDKNEQVSQILSRALDEIIAVAHEPQDASATPNSDVEQLESNNPTAHPASEAAQADFEAVLRKFNTVQKDDMTLSLNAAPEKESESE